MIKLSVVIITFNEEQNIARCLDSVKDVADEIVVVDSFSTDETEEICNRYNVRFIKNPFKGHIEQKNYAASLATYDYILSLDADECLSPELIESVKNAKANFEFDGYYLNRLSSYCGQWIYHCGWYPDQKLRLFNKTKGSWGGENPHDKYLMNPDAKTSKLKGDFLHYTFHTIQQHMNTVNSFSSIAALGRYRKGKKTNIFRIVYKPLAKFLFSYFFKLGFLDGYYGFIICINSAHSAFLKEVKLRELHLSKNNKASGNQHFKSNS